jgi:hypothetical protein
MLYYARDPIGLLEKYEKFLAPNGRFIISIYQKPEKFWLKSLAKRILHPRTPVSNLHCTRIIQKFMRDRKWTVESKQAIPIPNSTHHWLMWAVNARVMTLDT